MFLCPLFGEALACASEDVFVVTSLTIFAGAEAALQLMLIMMVVVVARKYLCLISHWAYQNYMFSRDCIMCFRVIVFPFLKVPLLLPLVLLLAAPEQYKSHRCALFLIVA